jgi:probable HAF family extracellular repeat protein
MRSQQILMTAALGLIMSAMTSTVAQAQLKYRVIPIAPGSGAGINDKGDVVGTLSDNHHAFLYKKRKISDLGVFYDPNNLPNYTDGNAVNDSDVVVGDITDAGSGTSAARADAFLWRTGQLIDIAQGTLDGFSPTVTLTLTSIETAC